MVWVGCNNGMPKNMYDTTLFDPAISFLGTDSFLLMSTSYNGIIRSDDNGATWLPSSDSLDKTSTIPLHFQVDSAFVAISALFKNNGTVYGASRTKVYTSNNSGRTWRGSYKLNSGIAMPTSIAMYKDYLFVGTSGLGIYYCPISGDTLVQYVQKIDFQNIVGLTVHGDYLYAATKFGGIFRIKNIGESWEDINSGINALRINSILAHDNHIIVATQNNGLYCSDNKGTSWVASRDSIGMSSIAGIGSYNSTILLLNANDTLLCLSGYFTKVAQSVDNGITWRMVKPNTSYTLIFRSWIWSGTQLILGETSSLYYSPDHGKTLIKGDTMFNGKTVMCFAQRNDTLLASCQGIYRSVNNGVTWTKINDLASKFALIFVGKFVFAADGGIYRSDDFGVSWTKVLELSYDFRAWDLKVSGDTLFAATQKGVLFSVDSGINWNIFGPELQNMYITRIVPAQDAYYIGTNDHSVYKWDTQISSASKKSQPSPKVELEGIKIIKRGNSLFVGVGRAGTLELYSLSGKIVLRKSLNPGPETEICLQGMGRGLYFMRLESGFSRIQRPLALFR